MDSNDLDTTEVARVEEGAEAPEIEDPSPVEHGAEGAEATESDMSDGNDTPMLEDVEIGGDAFGDEDTPTLEGDQPTHLLGNFSARGDAGDQEGAWTPLQDSNGRDLDGPTMRIARSTNDDFSEMMSKVLRKYGDGKGKIGHACSQWALPLVYAKSLLREIRMFRLGPLGETVSEITATVWMQNPNQRKKFFKGVRRVRFTVDAEGWLIDSVENRRKILMCFSTVQNQVWRFADDGGNFSSGAEAAEGN